MAHIALLGASGQAGSRILKELSARGHFVTAIARHPEKIPALPNVIIKSGDATDHEKISSLLENHDIVVSALRFADASADVLIDAVKKAGVGRYLVVGGAGSLEVAPGKRLIDQPDFPNEYRPEASRGAEFLATLKKEKELDWSFLSPSAEFIPGVRTGKFRLGGNALLTNEAGSSISFEDYAVAMVDEIENHQHSRQRFTVGY